MTQYKTYFNWVVYVLLALCLLYIQECTHRGTCPTTSASVIHDTTRIKLPPDTIPHNIPYPVYSHTTDSLHDTINRPFDTLQVLQAYFTKKFYNREFKDSDLKVNIFDTVDQNKLGKGSIKYEILKSMTEQIIINKIVSANKLHLYGELVLGGNTATFSQFTPGLTLITAKYHFYQFGDNFLLKQPNIVFGMGIKIF